MNKKPLRSVLYVPGSNGRAIEKARELPADAIIFDLEDAVSLRDKHIARECVCACIAEKGYGRRSIVVRINDFSTPTGRDDFSRVFDARPDAVLLPKVKTAQDIIRVSRTIDEASGRVDIGKPQIWAMIETSLAVLNIRKIAELVKTRVPRLTALVLGTNDLARETGIASKHMTPWLMECVLAAKAFDLTIIDGVYNQFSDTKGLRQECRRGRGMGMDGKSLIHPSQIEPCNEIFSPTSKELQEARAIVGLFEQSRHEEINVLEMNGRMVERLHYEMALEILQMAGAIAEFDR